MSSPQPVVRAPQCSKGSHHFPECTACRTPSLLFAVSKHTTSSFIPLSLCARSSFLLECIFPFFPHHLDDSYTSFNTQLKPHAAVQCPRLVEGGDRCLCDNTATSTYLSFHSLLRRPLSRGRRCCRSPQLRVWFWRRSWGRIPDLPFTCCVVPGKSPKASESWFLWNEAVRPTSQGCSDYMR